MGTVKTIQGKILVALIVFMLLFSNSGFAMYAIATSDEFQVITNGFFRKDEIAFKAYFEDENGKQLEEFTGNVNEKTKLMLEISPQVQGFLRTAKIKAVSSDGKDLNFKITGVSKNLLEDEEARNKAILEMINNNIQKNEDSSNEIDFSSNENEVSNTVSDVQEIQNEVSNEVVDSADTTNTVDVVDTSNTISNDSDVENTVDTNTVSSNTTESNTTTENVVAEESTNEVSNTTVVENAVNPDVVANETNPISAINGMITNHNTEQVVDGLSLSGTSNIEETTKPIDLQEEVLVDEDEVLVNEEDILIDEEEVIQEKTDAARRLEEEIARAILDIKVVADDEIEVSNIIKDTKIEVEIEYLQGEKLNLDDLLKDIKFQISGIYINSDLEEVKVAKEDKVIVGWKYSKDIELSSEYTKFSPFEIGEVKGTIVENHITIDRDIKDEKFLPVKTTRLEVDVPKVNEKAPIDVDVTANRLMLTRGEDAGYTKFDNTNWKYDENSRKIVIVVDNDELVYSKGLDEYTIIYRYEDFISEENSNLGRKVRATVEEYSAKENNFITKEINDSQDIGIDVGELVTYNISTTEDKLSKSKIYANYNSFDALYETEYTSQVNLNILTSDILGYLKVDCTKEFYKDANGVEFEASGVITKAIKFNFAEVSTILSEGGEIVINDKDGKLLHILNKDEIKTEDDCTILLNQVNGIVIYVRNIAKNGNINFELVKVIKKCNYDKAVFKSFVELESRVSAEVKYQNIDSRIELQTIGVSKELKESTTLATLSLNNPNLTTVRPNEDVELRIMLNNDREDSDLYIDPTFELVFPKYVTKVTVQGIDVLYDNGLRVSDFQTYEENGLIRMRIDLKGMQETFSENSMTHGTNIIINANIDVDEYTPAKEDQIKLYYCNEGVANYESQTKWTVKKQIPGDILKTTNGFDATLIKYQAPSGLVAINGIVNYDGNLSEVKSVKQGKVSAQIPINSPSRIATMELLALNNTENKCSDLVLIGRIPFKGNRNVVSNEDIGTNTDTRLVGLIKEDIQNPNTTTIYYSANPNADKNLANGENGWRTNIDDISTIRTFMIAIKGEIEPGQVLRYTYDFEIPENLYYDAKIAGSFGAFYNNIKDVAILYESSSADEVSLDTGVGPKIETTITAEDGENIEVLEGSFVNYIVKVENKGSEDVEGVTVKIPKPKYADFYKFSEYKANGVDVEGYKKIAQNELSVNMNGIKVGETKKTKIMLKVSTPLTEDLNRPVEEYTPEENNNDININNPVESEEEHNHSHEEFEEDNNILHEDIDIENLTNVGNIVEENKEYFVEVKASVNIKSLDLTLGAKPASNKIKKANFVIETAADYFGTLDIGKSVTYLHNIKNVTGKDLENVEIRVKLPAAMSYNKTEINEGLINEVSYEKETNTVLIKIPYLEKDENIVLYTLAKIKSNSTEKVTPEVTVKYEEVEEYAPEYYSTIKAAKIDVEKISESKTGTILEGEPVDYKIRVANIGENLGNEVLVDVTFSENLINRKITYTGSNNGYGGVNNNISKITLTKIPIGGATEITISGNAANYVGENQQIVNNVAVRFGEEEIYNSNTDALIIKENPNKIVEEKKEDAAKQPIQTPNNSNNSSNNNNGNNSNSNNNGTYNTNNKTNSSTTTSTNNKVNTNEKLYNIFGAVWLDENQDGERNDKEINMPSLEIRLYSGQNVIRTTKSSSKGIYTFSNVPNGTYAVEFLYDSSTYTTTKYNKQDIAEDIISKGIEVESGVAVSKEITISNADVRNINLGLILKDQFNLAIKKYIYKATVTEGKNVEKYEFDNLELTKLEIPAKKLNNSNVELVYKIVVENIGNAEGKAVMINDYLPDDMIFDQSKNKGWYLGNDGILYNEELKDTIISKGESKELLLVLDKKMNEENTGVVSNKVVLLSALNSEGMMENAEGNVATQETLILIKTGLNSNNIIILATITFVIAFGIYNREIIMETLNRKSTSYKNNNNRDKKFKLSLKRKYK